MECFKVSCFSCGFAAHFFFNDFWLSQIAYHTSIGFEMICISVLVLFFFGVITIGSQTLRAAYVNPVKSLKSE